jgi:hypothetical protein
MAYKAFWELSRRRDNLTFAQREAAEELVQWQVDFVAWWNGNVGVRESPGRRKSNADLRSILSVAKAESETGITQQQVSKWRINLKRPDYAAQVCIAASRKAAMAALDNVRGTQPARTSCTRLTTSARCRRRRL